jgi:hypothetical protein
VVRGSRFVRLVKIALGAVSLLSLTAYADGIQSWRTPNGSLYFGDRPPAGSTLLTTYADTPRESAVETPSTTSSNLAREAAEGREIMRRREEQRNADRQRELEEDARQQAAYVEPAYYDPYWIVGTSVPCTIGVDCEHVRRDGDHVDHHHHHASGSWMDAYRGGPSPPPVPSGGGFMRPAPAPAPPVRIGAGGGVSSFRR